MRYILFLDESGDHGLSRIDPSFPIFALCGTMLSEDSYQRFERILKDFKRSFWGKEEVILHSKDIRRNEKEFSILFDQDLKKRFYEQLNEIISSTDFTILSSVIKKEEYQKKYGLLSEDPYQLSLTFIVERAIYNLQRRRDCEKLFVVLEKRGRKEDTRLSIHMNNLLSRGTYYIEAKDLNKYKIEFHFRNKNQNISGLQLADLIAYPIATHVINPERANPAFDLIKHKFHLDNKGQIAGLKIFP